MADEVSEAGRALWRALWMVSADVQLQVATLSEADKRLLASEARALLVLVRQTNEAAD